jgi:hypothetical protein
VRSGECPYGVCERKVARLLSARIEALQARQHTLSEVPELHFGSLYLPCGHDLEEVRVGVQQRIQVRKENATSALDAFLLSR